MNGASVRVLAVALASLAWSAIASAAIATDPVGDNCKIFNVSDQWCGFDITGGADSVDAAGDVHLRLTYIAADCRLVGGTPGFPNGAGFTIYAAGVTAPRTGPLTGLIKQAGTGYVISTGPSFSTPTPIASSTSIAGGATTLDVAIPKSVAATLGASFTWLGSNTCIGESPEAASDIIPNTGLLTAAAAEGAPPPDAASAAAVQSAASTALAKAKPGGAAALLAAGGFTTSLTAPGAGTWTVQLTTAPPGAKSLGATKPVVIAKLKLRVTAAGKVAKKVALTAAGRTLLRKATRKTRAKLTVTFTAGTVTRSAKRIITIRPRPTHRSLLPPVGRPVTPGGAGTIGV